MQGLIDATAIVDAAERIGRALRMRRVFRVTRALLPPRIVYARHRRRAGLVRVFAVAGIARPERFFADLTSAGWSVVGTKSFRDHHRFSKADIAHVASAAKKAKAAIVLTTDKDAVRLPANTSMGLPLASVPLVSAIEPADEFRAWLLGQIR